MYGNQSVAVELAGNISTLHIPTSLLEWVDGYIDIYFGRTFSETTEISADDPEILDIPNVSGINTNKINLKNFPVTAVGRLRSDILGSSPTTVNALNYHLDKEAGIIQLTYNSSTAASGITQITNFKKGNATVDVAYTHGFASVPSQITDLANWIAAKLGRINYLESELAPGTSIEVKMANFTEKKFYDEKMISVKNKYDSYINHILLSLNKWRKTI